MITSRAAMLASVATLVVGAGGPVGLIGAGGARAEEGCALDFEADLPALTRDPSAPELAAVARATTLPIARALALDEADALDAESDPPWRSHLHQLALAARLAPDDVLPRVTLLRLLERAPPDAVDGCPDEVVDAWRGRLALDLTRCAHAGSAFCVRFLTEWLFGERRPAESAAPALAPVLALLGDGPPGATADAARRALAWLMGSLDPEAAPPPLAPNVRVAGERVGPRGLRAIWWGAEGDEHHEGTPGEAATGNWHRPLIWTCDDVCCEMPFHDQGPHSRQVTRLCFDAKGRLTELDWWETDIP